MMSDTDYKCDWCLDREGGCQHCNEDLRIGVHVTHCCVVHGCKYGDNNCPVADGTVEQDGPDEACYDLSQQWPTSTLAQILTSLETEMNRVWSKDENGLLVGNFSPEERSGYADALEFAIARVLEEKPRWF